MKRIREFKGMLGIGLLLFSFACATANAADKVLLEERTPIKVMLMESLKSGEAQVGQEVEFEVREDIYGPNREILIYKGTRAYGEVTLSKKSGIFGKGGKLDFTCDYVRAVDRTKVSLRCYETRNKSGKRKTGVALAAAYFVSPAFLLLKGKNCSIPKGTEFNVYVEEDTYIEPIESRK